MTLQEINTQIEETKSQITELNKQMYTLYNKTRIHKASLKRLKKEREDILFGLVCDYVDEGQELVLGKIRYRTKSLLKTGDTIRIIRKNAKSVTIQILATNNSRLGMTRDPRIGKQHRIQAHLFGRYVYNINGIKQAVERNAVLKELLG